MTDDYDYDDDHEAENEGDSYEDGYLDGRSDLRDEQRRRQTPSNGDSGCAVMLLAGAAIFSGGAWMLMVLL